MSRGGRPIPSVARLLLEGRVMDKPKKVLNYLWHLEMYISVIALAFLVCLTVAGVVMRYAVNRPIYWMEEVQLWCFVWVTFLGACAVARANAHIAIDAIISFFPISVRRVMGVVALAATIAVLLFLGYYSCFHVLQMYQRVRLTNILGIPYALIYAVVPVSCLIMSVVAIGQLVQNETVRKSDYDIQSEFDA